MFLRGSTRRARGQCAGAERATAGGDGNLAQALGAFLRGGVGWRLPAPHAGHERIHRHHHKKVHGRADHQERDHGVDEIADRELASVHFKGQGGKVLLPRDGRNQRRQQVFHQRFDDRAKRAADHHRYGQIDHVSAHEELPEAFQHGVVLSDEVASISRPRAQELHQPFHGGFQNRALGRITDADRTFAARSEGHAGRQAHARLLEQPLAEREGIFEAVDARENVERAVGFRQRDSGHVAQRREAEIAVLLETPEHAHQLLLALGQRRFPGLGFEQVIF